MIKRINVRAVYVFTFILIFASLGYSAETNDLFLDTISVDQRMNSIENVDDKVIRQRFVNINFALLNNKDANKQADICSKQIYFNLFSDTILTVQLDYIIKNKSGSYTWVGQVEGESKNGAILTIREDTMSGSISTGNEKYTISSVGEGLHLIKQTDHSKYPECMEPIPAPKSEMEFDEIGYDDGSVIDIMVVYTQSARSVVGGTTAMETLIDQAVSETNTGYSNSNVTQRVNLVHTAEVTYTELSGSSGWSETLKNLTYSGMRWEWIYPPGEYGYVDRSAMDNVHTLRDTYGADLVVMIQNEGTYCGLAYLNSSASSGFSLVHYSCATGYFSFAHEMGHNMGARHDRRVDNTDGSNYNFNHGYVYLPDRWRTIMAYNTLCVDNEFNCTRINYWSNPNVLYGGTVPMGVLGGAGVGADNHQTLDNTANTVANFRQSVSAASIEVTSPLGNETYQEGDEIPISWTSTGITGNVKITLRKSDGSGGYTIVSSTPYNNSPYNYTIPSSVLPGEYFVKVKQGTVNGVSNNFTIADITVSSPSSGQSYSIGQQIPVSWTSSGITGDVKITLRKSDGSGGYTIIGAIAHDTGTYNYAIPGEVTAGTYFVKVKQGIINGITDNFTITSDSSIAVTSPTGGQPYDTGEQIPITWTSSGITGNVKITLRKSDGSGGYTVVNSIAYDSSPFNYNIPCSVSAGTYFIKVKQGTLNGVSGTITISSSGTCISLSSPLEGNSYVTGNQIPIQWSTSGITGNVKITLRKSDGSGGYTIINSIAHDTATYNYTIPGGIASGTYFIKVKQGTLNGKTGLININ